MKKKEREHLKEDPFINFFHGILNTFQKFKRELTIAAVIVVVALVLLLAGILLRSRSLAAENRLYSEALSIMSSETMSADEKIGGLKNLDSGKGVSAATGIFLASLYFEQGNLEKAESLLDDMPRSRIDIINDQRQLLTADVLSGLGQDRQALEILAKLLSDQQSDLAKDYVLIKTARLQIRNQQLEAAAENLKRIIDQFPGSLYISEAETLLQQLESES